MSTIIEVEPIISTNQLPPLSSCRFPRFCSSEYRLLDYEIETTDLNGRKNPDCRLRRK